MADLTNYLEHAWLNAIRGGGNGVTFTAPAAVYVKLHVGDPGEDADQNASSETDRKAIEFDAAEDVDGKGTIESATSPEWADWDSGAETISHISVWDHETAGNPLAKGSLSDPKSLTDGDTLVLPAGQVTIDLD